MGACFSSAPCFHSNEIIPKSRDIPGGRNSFQDDFFVNLIQNQIKLLNPTYDQLLQITHQLNSIDLDISQDLFQRQIQIAHNLLKNYPQQDYNYLIKKVKPNLSLGRIKSRILYDRGNALVKDHRFIDLKLKELSSQQINDLVKYDHIEVETQKFMENFYLKFLEIRDSTQKIDELFTKCFSKNHPILENEGYFHLSNGIDAALFSRKGSIHDQRAIFIFINYLARTIKGMENKGISLELIEEAVRLLIYNISNLYPPGQDLVGDDENLKRTLQKIERAWDKEKQPLMNSPLIMLGEQQKKKKLEESIIERAIIASQELPYFNSIIRENCIKKCISVDSNLKLCPQSRNEKTLIRIIEKLLFKSQTQTQIDQNQGNNQLNYQQGIKDILSRRPKFSRVKLSDHLKEEEKKYQIEVERRLKDKQHIEFTISDMVRGKCTFSKIEDIIQTIENIKMYVQQQRNIDPQKYRILEIESRFTKPIPISDITLKIALHERIIAQLQLTLQSNVAAYTFAHKIYELERTIAFSKIKIIFNYYEEYRKQFQEVLIGQISLFQSLQSKQSQRTVNGVRKYFEIEKNSQKPTLIDALNDNQYQTQILHSQSKILVQAVFQRKMQKSNQQRALLFINHLNTRSQQTPFTSALFYQMIKDINVIENVNEICEEHDYFNRYLNKNFLDSDEDWELDACYLKTIRTQIKFEELSKLFGITKSDEGWKTYQFFLQTVYGNAQQMCEWLIKKGKIYAYTSKYQDSILYYQEALSIINTQGLNHLFINTQGLNHLFINTQGLNHLFTNTQINKAIALIKGFSFEQSYDILTQIKDQCKLAKQYKSATVCTLLLSQCALNKGEKQLFQSLYKEARQIGRMHKINFGGVEIADCEYRIAKKLFKQKHDPTSILQIHLACAFQQYSSFMHPRQLLHKMREGLWQKYPHYQLQQPILKPNHTIKHVDLRNNEINDKVCSYFPKIKWPNLKIMRLGVNSIGAEGCSYLIKADWPNLQEIYLCRNNIDLKGCSHLKNGSWPLMRIIGLEKNKIDFDSISASLLREAFPNTRIDL